MFAKWHYIYYAYVPAMLRLFCGRYEEKKILATVMCKAPCQILTYFI